MRNLTIATKLIASAALAALVSFGATAVLIYSRTASVLEDMGLEQLRTAAAKEGDGLEVVFNAPILAAEQNAIAIAGMLAAEKPDRDMVNAWLRDTLRNNPKWASAWVMFPPNGFDGRDEEFVGAPNHDASGAFFPVWVRTGEGDDALQVEYTMSYEDSLKEEWYTLPESLQRPVVLEPYVYNQNGVDTMMTSLIAPIMVDGQFRGVAGVDITLAEMVEIIGAIRPFEQSEARLISPKGNRMASRKTDELGKPLDRDNLPEIVAAIASDKLYYHSYQREGGLVHEVVAPILIGKSEENLGLVLFVPDAVIKAQAKAEGSLVLLLGVVGAAVISLVMFLLIRLLLQRPLAKVVDSARDMAAGNIERALPAANNDEIGQLLKAFSLVRERLQAIANDQIQLRQAHLDGQTTRRIDTSAYSGIYAEMAGGVNALAESHIEVSERMVAVISCYAEGDFSQEMDRLPGDRARITAAMDKVRDNLVAIKDEILRLGDAAAGGDFSLRGDDKRFAHTFRQMVEGLNRLMETSEQGLSEIARVLKALSQGDLTQRIEAEYQGLFGQLKDTANHTAGSLTGLIGRIQAATTHINTAAREIASGNADLSARTEEQAASLEETASSMEELTSTVKQNAENARQANQLAVGASEVAVKGGEVVSKVVRTMDSINESSQKIVDIITVIDGIAFQTNILALNAAVEAARAGEQGRGFAVVASEVRALAQRSATAAKEIKTLIDDSVGRISEGSQLVDQAGQTMGEIVTSVKRVTDIMAEITAASMEQSSGIEQVNQTVTQMDEVTQQNAALVEEATAAARSMEEQAGQLSEAVAAFRLRNESEAGTAPTPAAGKPRAVVETSAATSSAPKPTPPRTAAKSSGKPPGAADATTGGADQHWQEF